MSNRIIVTILLTVLFLIASCGKSTQSIFDPMPSLSHIRSIALMPLENLTPDKAAANVLTKIFYEQLKEIDGITVLSTQEVQRRLISQGSVLDATNEAIPPRDLAKILKVDAIFFGSVFEYFYLVDVREGKVVSREPVVSMQVRVAGAREDRWVWIATQSKTDSSVILRNRDNIVAVAESAVRDVVGKFSKALLR